MKTKDYAIAALLGASLLAGCGGAPVKKAEAPAQPAWIVKGTGAYSGEAETIFYGVGIANAMPDISLQRKMADERAREEIAVTLKISIKSMIKDYQDHHVDYFNAADTAGSDEFSSHVSKSVVDAELVDSKIIDHWSDPDTGALYSLARMDTTSQLYDQYKESLKEALREQNGAVLKARTDEALKDLDTAVQDQRSREKQIMGVTEAAPAAGGAPVAATGTAQ
jgi:hypothetical protein